jgi:hypothetical protein
MKERTGVVWLGFYLKFVNILIDWPTRFLTGFIENKDKSYCTVGAA